MSYFASVNGLPIVSGTLLVPAVGAWTADLHLATETPVSGAATVVIGNLTLAGTVFRSEPYGGQVRARLVGGAGGWRTVIPPQGYGSGSGVSISTVLTDAANACGERVNVPSDGPVGQAFARVAFSTSVASDVLWQLVAQKLIPGWYIDPTGVTQTATWPTSTVTSSFTITDQKPDEGIVVVATEDYVSWLPGASFSAPQLQGTYTSAGAHYVWTDDGKFRFEVLTGTGGDRILGPIQQIVQKELAPTRFHGRYAYKIANPSKGAIDGSPIDNSLGLPDLQNVPICGDSISTYVPPADGIAHIMFVDGVPTQPVCVWTSSPPTNAAILNGANPAAKLGDTVQSMISGSALVLAGSSLVAAGTVPGTITVTGVLVLQGLSPISGSVTTGTSQVGLPD